MTLPEIDFATREAAISLELRSRIYSTSVNHSYALAKKGLIKTVRSGKLVKALTGPIREDFSLPPTITLQAA